MKRRGNRYRPTVALILGILVLAGSLLQRQIVRTDEGTTVTGNARTHPGATDVSGPGGHGGPGGQAGPGRHDGPDGRNDPTATDRSEGSLAAGSDIPASDLVTLREIRRAPEGTSESVSWLIPSDRVAGVLAILETDYPGSRYRTRYDDGRWRTEAVIRRDRHPETMPTDSRQSRSASLRSALAALLPPRPEEEPNPENSRIAASPGSSGPGRQRATSPVTTDTADGTGGSGYVLLRDRGRMDWMWDSEVLRLEPAR